MSACPGVPMKSGLRTLSEEEQEQYRRGLREIQRRITPFIEDVERCRRAAAASAITAVIG